MTLYALGDKYAIPMLCGYVADFKFTMQHLLDCITKVHSSRPPGSYFMRILLDCITMVYTSTPENDRTLRNYLVHGIARSSKDMSRDQKEMISEAMRQNDQFHNDLTLYLLEDFEWKGV